MRTNCSKLDDELSRLTVSLLEQFYIHSRKSFPIYISDGHFCKPLLRKNSRCKKSCYYESKEFNIKVLTNEYIEHIFSDFLEVTKEKEKRKIREIAEKEILFHFLKEGSK
jgi:hypothetical protein